MLRVLSSEDAAHYRQAYIKAESEKAENQQHALANVTNDRQTSANIDDQ